MMCPNHGAVDHVGIGIPPDHFSQDFEHRIEHACRHPSSVTAEHTVPPAIVIRQVTPLRSGSGNPHHASKIQTIVLCRTAATTRLWRKQRPDDGPFLV
nr:hypothetical protein [Acetobacter aceti]